MVQVWYPARPTDGPRARYVQDGAALAPIARVLGLPPFVMSHLQLVRTHAVEDAPPAALGPRPVLIFSHGRGGYRQHNTYMVEALVSRGYVVAAIEHPHAAAGVVFPDGRVTSMDPRMMDQAFVDWSVGVSAQDARFVADRLEALNADDPEGRLAGRLDLQRLRRASPFLLGACFLLLLLVLLPGLGHRANEARAPSPSPAPSLTTPL